jgi:hypothetical protein
MPHTYDDIKRLAAHLGVRVKSLLAMADTNDPFYAGSPAGLLHAQWFAGLWDACGYTDMVGIHLRRMHYKVVSTFPGLLTADTSAVRNGTPGRPYTNTEDDWKYLVRTSALARALGLVPVDAIVDHRNPPLADEADGDPLEDEGIDWYQGDGGLARPTLPATFGAALDFTLPTPMVTGYGYDHRLQDYLVEIWVEKSTMNDILEPLATRYGARVVPFIGFVSITSCVQFLKRAQRGGRPGRILYLSDFDPAGQGMPLAAARQLEKYRDTLAPHCDVKLTPLFLTKAQVVEYGLPRIPISDEDKRKENFEDRHGEGAVELDALEALRPGELRRIVEFALDQYIDLTLRGRLARAQDAADERLQADWEAKTAPLQDKANDLEDAYRAKYARYNRFLGRLRTFMEQDLADLDAERLKLEDKIAEAREAYKPPALERPTPDVEPDDDDWLYSSDRPYLEQIKHYHAHKEGLAVEAWEAREAAAQEEKDRRRAQRRVRPVLSEEELLAPFPEGCDPYDRSKHMLGPLCPQAHAWGTTGQSRRAIRDNGRYGECMQCKADRTARGRRKSHAATEAEAHAAD